MHSMQANGARWPAWKVVLMIALGVAIGTAIFCGGFLWVANRSNQPQRPLSERVDMRQLTDDESKFFTRSTPEQMQEMQRARTVEELKATIERLNSR